MQYKSINKHLFSFSPLVSFNSIGIPEVIIIFTVLFFVFFIGIFISILVFRDAKKLGMNPWFWTAVAVFIPSFIGVIIYLIVRQSAQKVCVNCSRGIQGDYKVCPYCGHSQELICEKCKKKVDSDWKICPYCKNPLNSTE